jgi:hypothetical protein
MRANLRYTVLSIALGAIMGLAAATPARADFTATGYSLSYGESSNWGTVHYTGGSYSYWAGAITWATSTPIHGLTGLSGLGPNQFNAFCVELTQDATQPETFHAESLADIPDSRGGMGTNAAAMISALLAQNPALSPSGSAASTSKEEYAELQLAIWDIVYNGGAQILDQHTHGSNTFYLDTSGMSVDPNFLSKTNSLLSSIDLSYSCNVVGLLGVNHAQDMVVELPNGNGPDGPGDIVSTPAPPAFLLALFGVVPCLAFRRRLSGLKLA